MQWPKNQRKKISIYVLDPRPRKESSEVIQVITSCFKNHNDEYIIEGSFVETNASIDSGVFMLYLIMRFRDDPYGTLTKFELEFPKQFRDDIQKTIQLWVESYVKQQLLMGQLKSEWISKPQQDKDDIVNGFLEDYPDKTIYAVMKLIKKECDIGNRSGGEEINLGLWGTKNRLAEILQQDWIESWDEAHKTTLSSKDKTVFDFYVINAESNACHTESVECSIAVCRKFIEIILGKFYLMDWRNHGLVISANAENIREGLKVQNFILREKFSSGSKYQWPSHDKNIGEVRRFKPSVSKKRQREQPSQGSYSTVPYGWVRR